MRGFFKFVGFLVIIGFIYGLISEDKANSTSQQPINTQQIYKTSQHVEKNVQSTNKQNTVDAQNKISDPDTLSKKEDKRLFRYKQCEEVHSEDYCHCLLGHVGKKLGIFEEAAWLEGGALTSVEGRKALVEAEILCEDIDREYWQKKIEERKKEEESLQKKWVEKKNRLLNYNEDFCNLNAFKSLLDSHNEYKKDEIEVPVDDIKLVEISGEKLCKISFSCTWCGEDKITTQLFFRKSSSGKLEFDVDHGTDASNTLYFLAVWINNPETVKDLINKGADVNYKYKENKDSFFTRIIGIGSKYFELAKLCIENGANISDQYTILDNFSPTIYKQTPLMKAINGNDIKTAELLLQKGVDLNIPQVTIKEDGQKTELLPIERVIPVSDPEWLKLLLKHGAKVPEYGYVDGQKMPLVWAVILDNPDNLVERLGLWLANGANANAEFRFNTEIKTFNSDGTIKRIKPDYKTQQPIEYAENNNMLDVVQLLQKYGAKPKHEVIDVRWCNTEFGRQICGTFINNTDTSLISVYIEFSLYDQDGAIVDITNAAVTNLGPKEKWKFNASVYNKNVKSYKLKEINVHE